MTMRDLYDDVVMFGRCYRDTFRCNWRNFGWFHGPRLTFWCGMWGVELQREYRDAERAGLLTPMGGGR